MGKEKQGWGKKASQKSHFLGSTPKPLPILDFGVHHGKEHKKCNQNKKLSKLFDNVSSNFQQRSWISNCQKFFSYYFGLKFGRILWDVDVNTFYKFQIFLYSELEIRIFICEI